MSLPAAAEEIPDPEVGKSQINSPLLSSLDPSLAEATGCRSPAVISLAVAWPLGVSQVII